jgi:tetratricopeptide (TPR) repeat protein
LKIGKGKVKKEGEMKGRKGEILVILLVLFSVSCLEGADTMIIKAGKADHFLVAAPSQVLAGETFKVRIEARDTHNNLVTDYDKEGWTLNLITDGTGRIKPEIVKATGFKGGIAQVKFTYTLAEPITITVKDETATRLGTSRRIMVRPGPLHHFIVTTPPRAVAGEPFSVKIEAQDIYNNTISDYSRIGKGIKITTNSPGIINPRTVPLSNFEEGVTLVKCIFNKTGTISLRVEEQGGKEYGRSNDMIVAPGRIDHFVVSTPSSAVAGEPFKIKIEARDAYNNLVTDYNRRGRGVRITTNGAGLIKPGVVPASSFREGVAEVFFTYDKAESFTIIAAERTEVSLPKEEVSKKILEIRIPTHREILVKAEEAIEKRMETEAQTYFKRAVRYIDRNEYVEAKNSLEKVLKLDPDNFEVKELLEKLKSVMKILGEK